MMLPILITLMVIGAQALPQWGIGAPPRPPQRGIVAPPRPPQRPSTTPGDALIRKFDDGDDLPGDCTIVDFKAGHIRECASKGTYPQSLNGTFGILFPNENKRTNNASAQLLDKMKTYAQPIIREKHLDPLPLPDYVYDFNKKVLGHTFYGKAEVHDGYLEGLSEFDICGQFVRDRRGAATGITAILTYPNLNVTYSGEVTFMDVVHRITATANTIRSIGYITFVYNYTSCQFEATDFSLSTGVFNFVISDVGPLDWILSGLITALGNLIHGFLQSSDINKLKDALNEAMNKVKFDSFTHEFTCSAFQLYPTTHGLEWATTIPNIG